MSTKSSVQPDGPTCTDRDADEIIDVLEKIDNVLDKDNISLVKIDDEGAEDQGGNSKEKKISGVLA